MGNHHSLGDHIKKWCARNKIEDDNYYLENAICFKGPAIITYFNGAHVAEVPKVLDVNFKTYTEECACNIYVIFKPNKNMLTLNAHLFIFDDMKRQQYFNFQLTPALLGLHISGMSQGKELSGLLENDGFSEDSFMQLNFFSGKVNESYGFSRTYCDDRV